MKRLFIIGSLVLLVTAFASSFVPRSQASESERQSAVFEFKERVKLRGVYLTGKCLFVHDEKLMAAGQPCTEIYSYEGNRRGELLTSFHCTPVARGKVSQFTLTSVWRGAPHNIREVREYQFAGSTEGHQVP